MREALVATSRRLFRVDLVSGDVEIVDEGYGLYFGVTWDESSFYVAARWYPPLTPTSAVERPRLVVLDGSLCVQERRRFPLATGGLHQILYYEGELYCSCSREDRFVIGMGERWRAWYPSPDPAHHDRDTHHFNSVWIDGDRMYLMGHNNGPSTIWELTYPDRELIAKHDVGHTAHNVWREPDGQIAICNSRGGRVETVNGDVICTTGGFPRGAAIGEDFNVIGISSVANRSNRWLTPGTVHVYDKSWSLVRQIRLGLCGQVNEIRLLGPDSAHNGLKPPIS